MEKVGDCVVVEKVKWQRLRNISATYAVRIAIIPRDSESIMTKSTKTTFISARKMIVVVFSPRMQDSRFIKKEAIKEGPRVQCALSSPLQTTKALPTLVLMFRSENAVIHYKAAEHQQLIVDVGALPHLNTRAVNSVIRRAPDFITNLAHENNSSKTDVRIEGIPPLVELLQYVDSKVQRAAAGVLQTLAFKNDENKNQIVSCNALPTLVLMLRSEDDAIHYEVVGVIGNLVNPSPNIKKEVLNVGALQPVIGLLSSCCTESQREAALLLRQFAATDSDCKVHTVQRGATWALIEILQSPDVQLRVMAAFALGRLTQDTHNQAGIAYDGGLMPLLKLLESNHGPLQHNAVFALYGLADNEDNVSDFIKVGGVQKLQDGESIVQIHTVQRGAARVPIEILQSPDVQLREMAAFELGRLAQDTHNQAGIVSDGGLMPLLKLLESKHGPLQHNAAFSLYGLADNEVYLGIQFVNNATLSDVTFLIEGKQFHAHRITLLASSDALRAMFDGGYMERDARDIEILNIGWEVCELMMRYIYTGSVDITLEVAQDFLRAADQYLLDGLKRLCECAIAKDTSLDNIASMYELSEAFHAMTLRNSCIMFILEHHDKLVKRVGYNHTIQRVLPDSLLLLRGRHLLNQPIILTNVRC